MLRARTIIAFIAIFLTAFLFVRMDLVLWIFVLLSIVFLFVGSVMLAGYLRFSEEERKKAKVFPSVSVLVPCYNRASTIEKCVNAIKAMSYPKKFEIIVVDDASKDNSFEILKKISGIIVLRQKKNSGKAAALNRAMKAAKGEVVACIDADTFPTKQALERMAVCFHSEKVGAVTALIKPSETKSLLQKAQEIEYLVGFGFTQSAMSAMNTIIVTPGPMAMYRRKMLIELGGYDEHNLTEDMEIALRVRKNHFDIIACPEAVVYTEVPGDFRSWLKQRERWYRGKIFNTWKYRDVIFRLEYGEISHFGLPLTFLLEMSSVFMLFLIVARIADTIIYGAQIALGAMQTGFLPLEFSIPIANTAALFVNAVILGNFTVSSLLAHRLAGEKLSLRRLPAVVFIIIFYSLLVSIIWFVCLFKEINKSSSTW